MILAISMPSILATSNFANFSILAIVIGVDAQGQSHGRFHVEEGGGHLSWIHRGACACSAHLLPASVSCPVSGAEAHGPVDEVEHQEHDGEHNKEHIINFGSGMGHKSRFRISKWRGAKLFKFFNPTLYGLL